MNLKDSSQPLTKKTKIYTLSIQGGVFYIGKTDGFLAYRLRQHKSGTPGIKDMPYWMKLSIKIEKIWECSCEEGAKWEKYWIRFYCSSGACMLNVKHSIEWTENLAEPKIPSVTSPNLSIPQSLDRSAELRLWLKDRSELSVNKLEVSAGLPKTTLAKVKMDKNTKRLPEHHWEPLEKVLRKYGWK